MTSKRIRDEAVEKGTVRGKRAPAKTDVKVSKTPKRKYTLHLRPILREEGDERAGDGGFNKHIEVFITICMEKSLGVCLHFYIFNFESLIYYLIGGKMTSFN